MVRRLIWAAVASVALAAAASADARRKPAPPPPPPAPVIPQVRSGDAAVDAFYFYDRAGQPVWTRDDASRQAAGRVVGILKRAPIDGLAQGPALAATVETALASGTLNDDALISLAWLKYVKALRTPVGGVEYGDPSLMLKLPTAKEVLGAVVAAPSPLAHVDAVASVNSFYSTLRGAAVANGAAADPHVRATLDRLRLIPAKGKIIVVDTANQRLMMVEDGTVAGSMKIIVGKLKSPTPLIAGKVHYVTLNPYWNIPMDVVQRRVAPTVVKRGVSYLKAARYVTTSKWGADAVAVDPSTIDWKAVAAGTEKAYLRQLPGVNNMMGHMKFGFANRFDIFLHDTPHRDLFNKSVRNLSMGCVRLEHAPDLARWLLGTEPVTSDDAPEQQVALSAGVPVYTVYLTASVDGDKLVYANDVYGFDQPAQALATVPTAGAVADDGTR